jgi:hypothetical protein
VEACLRIGNIGRTCEHSNEPLGSIRLVEFFMSRVILSFVKTLFHGVGYLISPHKMYNKNLCVDACVNSV